MDEIISNLANSISSAFGSNPLVVFLMSMLPIVEVRGGIPVGLELKMSPADSFGYAILASLVVTPIILFLLKAVIRWMCKSKIFGNFGKALNSYFYEKAQKVESGKIVQKKSNVILKYLALYAFVAAPLPLTGYWTGSAVAVFLNLNPFISFFVIALGNMTAGGLILAMSLLLGDKAYIITIIFIIFIPIVLGILIYKLVKKRKQSASQSTENVGVLTDSKVENKNVDGKVNSTNLEASESIIEPTKTSTVVQDDVPNLDDNTSNNSKQ